MSERTQSAELILVHGLWFGAWAMVHLESKLQDSGFTVRRFDYATTDGDLSEHALELAAFASKSQAATQHFVAHSLGGLVTLKMLSTAPPLPPGRVVLLGSPLKGSSVAQKSGDMPGGEYLFGDIQDDLEQGFTVLPGDRQVGMIAGSKAIGLGRLFGAGEEPGDGTVAVRETRVPGLRDHVVLPVTHTGMLYSDEVARQAAAFLHNGWFETPLRP